MYNYLEMSIKFYIGFKHATFRLFSSILTAAGISVMLN